MSKIIKTCLALMAPYLLCASLAAAEAEPHIVARFFSADAIKLIPKLQHLGSEDPDFNKILFKVEGYPINKELIFEIKRLAGKDPKKFEPVVIFSIQEDGSYVTNSQQQIKSIVSSSKGFLPGERVVYRIHTADNGLQAEIAGIPTPAIAKDKQGNVAVRAELLSISPTVYAIDLPLMTEGEEYELKSTSIGQIVKAKPKFSRAKPFHYCPSTSGISKGGEGVLEIRRKSGDLYVIKLPWGTALEPYRTGQKAFN